MKLKYYLRGLGIGIILTTIILTISYSGRKVELTDEEIMQRAEALGMIMEEDSLFPGANKEEKSNADSVTESEMVSETESMTEMISEQETIIENSEVVSESENTMKNSETILESENTGENNETISGQENTGENNETISRQENAVENNETVAESEVYRLTIYPGSSAQSIGRELEQNGIIADRDVFSQYLVDVGYSRTLLVGEYHIPYGVTVEDIYKILKEGPL